MSTKDDLSIESVMQEDRVFPPPSDFASRIGGVVHVKNLDEYRALYEASLEDPAGFWGEIGARLPWSKPWDAVHEGGLSDSQWFIGGETNACWHCVDYQVEQGHGDELAILWEGEPTGPEGPELRRLSYRDLQAETARVANVLASLGVKKGDVVTLYMGMVPELPIAMLACARLGAAHSVIFGGFSGQAIADRVADAGSRVIVTCDGAWRRGQVVPLKDNVDEALGLGAGLDKVLVLRRCGNGVAWNEGRDLWWHDLVPAASADCPCVPVEANELLFLLYTSGSTGKPKGIAHAVGGYLAWTWLTAKLTFNLQPGAGQVYWCTADIGWVTGHSYVVYGILPHRVPCLMYEGAPNFPAPDRFWEVIERHRVTHFYTAPTAIRAFMKWGDEHPQRHDLSSLALLGTVGEPINPEAWMWYHRVIGAERCPIVDTWWQTETGGHAITPLPGAVPTVPGSCTLPFPGIDAAVVNERGEELPHGTGGLLVIRKPWPGMLRGIHGDRPRYLETYYSRVPGAYLAGDGARRDSRGYFWVMGRVDDVIKVAGHRLGTAEIESALVSHPSVVEAAVVGMPDELRGQAIAAFVTLAPSHHASEALTTELKAHVAHELGHIAKPELIRFTDALPKTRSGKIMRRLLRDVAAGTDTKQDTTTLEDLNVLARLRADED